ncbi:ammonium transporter [Nocardia tengchongensis]
MRFKKFAATSALAIAAVGVSAGTAYAAPAAAPEGIHWDTKIDGASVVLKTDAGSLTTDNGQFQVRAADGAVVTSFPLNFVTGDVAHPVAAQIDGNTATFTPNLDPAAAFPAPALPAPALHDVASQADQDSAMSAAVNQFGLSTSMGTLLGTLIGGVAGCALGAAGGALAGVVIMSVPTGIAGCVAGAAIGIPLGAASGLVLTGVPAAIAVGIGLYNRMTAPDSTPAS